MAVKIKKMLRRQQLEDEENGVNLIRDWAALPEGLLGVILKHMPLRDCMSFGGVCKSWKKVLADEFFHRQTRGIPWLIMSGQNCKNIRNCFSILEDACYEINIPEANGKYIWGSFQEWLFMVKRDKTCFLQICLLNPFSRIMIFLPEALDIYYMMVLSGRPTEENCVFMLVGFKVRELAFWTPGTQVWHRCRLGSRPFEDAVFFKGCFYLLNWDYSIWVIDAQSVLNTINRDRVAEISPQFHHIQKPGNLRTNHVVKYLVECYGDLLLVCRFFSPDAVLETYAFEIYMLDISHMAWVKLESLGDQILYVGKCCSRSFCAKEFGVELANCIYFTNDGAAPWFNEWDTSLSSFGGSDVNDWGTFSLDNGSTGQFLYHGHRKKWAPIWITAPLWWFCRNN